MRLAKIVSISIAAVTTFGGGSAARADVPAAQTLTGCFLYGGGVITNARSCSTANGSATAALLPVPTLTASANYPGGNAPVMANSFAAFLYYFAVLGGSPGDVVPVEISWALGAHATGNATGDANFSVTTSNGFLSSRSCIGLDCVVQTPPALSGTFHVSVVVGAADTANHLDGQATAVAYSGSTAGTADAMVDPSIFIDPSFVNAANYRIVTSAGVGNPAPAAPAVPEPASWALMILGFGATGYAMRRRTRVRTDLNFA